MTSRLPAIVVAGHICLDIIPTFPEHALASTSRIEPGKLYIMGPALFSTGGAVSNTGLALHRLGIPTMLMGKVANDLFGSEVLNIVRRCDPDLARGMIVDSQGHTSYSVVISPPGVDRSFLHSPGANDTFTGDDICLDSLSAGQIFHFGYPVLMHHFFADEGVQMRDVFARVRDRGLITSLDMAMPDPHSPAGRIDWRAWLARVLPQVDLFLPSIEEILFMLERPGLPPAGAGPDLLQDVAEELLQLGAGVVVLKLGEQGLYLRSGTDLDSMGARLAEHAPLSLAEWRDRELWGPCFRVEVAGTTGAGDCTIAGFLAAFSRGWAPELTLNTALAVGACSVEVADSTSGIHALSEIQQRMAAGWPRCFQTLNSTEWSWCETRQLWRSTRDDAAN